MKKKVAKFSLLILTTLIFLILFFQKKNSENLYQIKSTDIKEEKIEDLVQSNSNIIENVRYVSKDNKGNEYIIEALEGEIDYSNPDIIFLKSITAFINLADADNLKIKSNYGKYNLNNYDTIFSNNVVIDYLNNKVNGEYLDFSFERNSMIISREVVYSNLETILNADVIEINIKNKDIKIFMYEENKTVNIKNNWHGCNQKI